MRRLLYMTFLTMTIATARAWEARTTQAQSQGCYAVTVSGDVEGLDHGSSCAFLGIPYATPPVAALRWRAPQPTAPWAPGVLSATAAPLSCPQLSVGNGLPMGSEDCLKLNVWTPNPPPASGAPVVVWFHPGSFVNASAYFAPQNGEALAAATGAIVVATNYRLGPFGFLGHQALSTEGAGAGNYGFLDQRAALAWVRDHIAAFGGDPGNVTIGGQSAGAHSVSLHLVSPGSEGLFHRAIMQSGYASSRWRTAEEARSQGNEFAASLGCTDADASSLLACLRSKSVGQILMARPPALFEQFSETGRTQWTPVVDGTEIPDQPRHLYAVGAFSRVPLLLGANRDEGWTFVQRSFPAGLTADQYIDAIATEFGPDATAILAAYPAGDFASPRDALATLTGDAEYVCEARRVARLFEQAKTPVFLYSFEHEVDPVVPDRVVHGIEVNFVFGNSYGPPLFPSYALGPADLLLAHAISGYWTRFARSGHPNTDDPTVAHWPEFTRPSGPGRGVDKYLALQLPVGERLRLREAQCDFWEPYFFRSLTGSVPAEMP